MSPDSDSITIAKLYRLKEDGSNWAVYRDRTTDYLKSKGLRSHLNGRVKEPIEIVERINESTNTIQFFKPDDTAFATPLSDKDVGKLEDAACEYDKNQGLGSDVLNNTVPTSIYREIHHLTTLAAKWKALHDMFEHRGNVVQIDLLTKLQSARYTGGSMRAFLSQLTEWRNDLLDNDYNLSDSQFVTYITSSLASTPDYRMFISAIEGAAEVAGTTLTSEVLKKRLIAEHEARNGINSNATSSGSGSTALASSRGNGKRMEYYCTICNVNGHSKERCFAEGGGRHDQAPEWYKRKQAERLAQEGKTQNTTSTPTGPTTANVSTTTSTIYSCVAEGPPQLRSPVAMAATTNDHQGTILDCGASDHFTPFRHLLTDYVDIHQYSRVADNHTTHVAGKGTMIVELPMGPGQPPTKLTLMNVYYVPSFVFTLISTTRMDLAGFTILKRDGLSTITAPDGVIIGRVPLIRGLYRVTDPISNSDGSTPLHANVTTISSTTNHSNSITTSLHLQRL
ncbi:hypothetical protein H1R20_g13297, partial [Candolleomyces eurysporus]